MHSYSHLVFELHCWLLCDRIPSAACNVKANEVFGRRGIEGFIMGWLHGCFKIDINIVGNFVWVCTYLVLRHSLARRSYKLHFAFLAILHYK